ncbi:extracellular solute-binding protein [Paenibacillus sp. sptzw28]|uniref:ABC transporter substrate-binding protein n=1 Tax=Paenibacillus sp. sptzw28 TaxID=715179 RepID=UPI001C6E0C5C|nr:extracellular solute-binding protein [Paenibacillus sp. sptzw28]QYR23474.1 extracellular solute-binding protein [Paenibacillus sp. sptzw28]
MKKQAKVWKMGVLILLCAALTACSGGKNNNAPEGTPTPTDSKPETSNGKTVVTMSVLTKDRFLAEAEQKFEAANPNIDVQVNELVPADTSSGDKVIMRQGSGENSGEDSGTKTEELEKYANSVNTALMSGNASDIISVENLPVGKYADKELLMDWNELAGKDSSFNKSDYYENIFDGVSKGSGLYGIPTSFSLDVMLGDDSLLKQNSLDHKTWTWDQFVDLLIKTKTDGKYGIASVTPAKMLGFLVQSVYGELVKKDGDSTVFDADAFRAYMENVKKLYDSGVATEENMAPNNTSFNKISMSNPMDLVLMPKLGGKSQAMLRPPGTGKDEGIPFKSNLVLGLNAKSKVKDAAWSFVKFLLSEEMQSARSMMNFAVNKAALKNKLVETQQMLDGTGTEGRKPQISIKNPDGVVTHPTLSDEDIDKVLDLVPSVGKYSNQDPKVISMIIQESAAYFSGSKSADAVAKSIANRINTYLNE